MSFPIGIESNRNLGETPAEVVIIVFDLIQNNRGCKLGLALSLDAIAL